VRVELSGATGAAAALAAVPGVSAVRPAAAAEGREGFSLSAEGDPVPEIVALAAARGWRVHHVGREQRTLEQVYRALQQAHVEGRAGVAA
jgi:hypothetical protein